MFVVYNLFISSTAVGDPEGPDAQWRVRMFRQREEKRMRQNARSIRDTSRLICFQQA